MVPGAPGPGGGKEDMKTSDLENHPDLSRQKKNTRRSSCRRPQLVSVVFSEGSQPFGENGFLER